MVCLLEQARELEAKLSAEISKEEESEKKFQQEVWLLVSFSYFQMCHLSAGNGSSSSPHIFLTFFAALFIGKSLNVLTLQNHNSASSLEAVISPRPIPRVTRRLLFLSDYAVVLDFFTR